MRNSLAASVLVNTLVMVAVLAGMRHAGWIGPRYTMSGGAAAITTVPNSNTGARPLTVEEIVARASPATVSVVAKKLVTPASLFDSPLPFFLPPMSRNEAVPREEEIGSGSGFLVSPDGYIVTNRHVVADEGATYTVSLGEGEEKTYPAEVVARDSQLDIALLKIHGSDFPRLAFGNSDQLQPGQTIIAIGNPLGELPNSVSVGVVSGLSRSIVAGDGFGQSEVLEEVIQTDAAINPGNSGGPLLNLRGEVVGINVAVARGSENIGFALPANAVAGIVDSVVKTGEIVRPYLGIRYQLVTAALKEKNRLPVASGVIVSRGATPEELAVIPGSPADKAGIVENDIILELDGVRLDAAHSLASLIRKKAVGQRVRLKLWSKGREREVSVILERYRD